MEETQIPKNLEEALDILEKELNSDMKKMLSSGPEEDMSLYHHDLGRYLRNTWKLWGDSSLKDYFNALGIQHADDMSGIILTSFWRRLNHLPIKIEEQVVFYKEYWLKEKADGITTEVA